MSFTKQVFVVEDAVADTNAIGLTDATVTNTTLGVYKDGALQGTATAALAAGYKYHLATKLQSTIEFELGDIVKVSVDDYTAGTKQTLKISVVPDSDGSAYVKLIDVTDGRQVFPIATFEVTGQGTANSATAIAALINATTIQGFENVAASAASTVLTVTADYGQILKIAGNDASTIVTTGLTAPVLPLGTYEQVMKEWEQAGGYTGVTNQVGPHIKRPNLGFASTTTWDRLIMTLKQRHGVRDDVHEVVIYFPSDSYLWEADIDTLFGITSGLGQAEPA